MSLVSLVPTKPGVFWTNRCGEIFNLNQASPKGRGRGNRHPGELGAALRRLRLSDG